MAPLQQEWSHLEAERLQIVERTPCREGFYTPPGFDTVGSQDGSLDTLSILDDVEVATLSTSKLPVNEDNCCCCCCPICCC